jgi:hypothetical protein
MKKNWKFNVKWRKIELEKREGVVRNGLNLVNRQIHYDNVLFGFFWGTSAGTDHHQMTVKQKNALKLKPLAFIYTKYHLYSGSDPRQFQL